MRLSHICSLLHGYLPQVTSEFSDAQNVTLSINTGVVTVTATAHGLLVGAKFTLSGFVSGDIINFEHTVVTVVDANTFTFTIIQEFITATNQAGVLHKNIRIYPTASVQLAVDSYSKQGNGAYKKVLYVVDLGESTSKDRTVGTDATFEMIRSTDFKMSLISRFGLLAVLPMKNDVVGATTAEFARELLAHFIHTIVGVQLPADWINNKSSAVTLISSSRESSSNAFIAQNYTFEVTEYVGHMDVNRYDFGYNITDINLRVIPKIGE